MPSIDFQTFLSHKDSLVWRQSLTWIKGAGTIRHLAWKGFFIENGRVTDIPAYFAYITVDDESGNMGVALTANVRFDVRGRGQQVIDKFTVGNQNDVTDQFLMEVMRQRYGLTEVDFSQTPVAPRVGRGNWQEERVVSDSVLIRKSMYNNTDLLLALVFLRKIVFLKSPAKYQVNAIVAPISIGLKDAETRTRKHEPKDSAKEGMDDFNGTVRMFRQAGFNAEVEVPADANDKNWDFNLGAPMEVSKAIKQTFEDMLAEMPEPDDVYDNSEAFVEGSASGVTKTSQTNQYYQGALPNAEQLAQYVGTPSVEASQIRSIFGGVDEAINLVNQFDSALLRDVAFIYNVTGGNAYGVYMSAIDDQIRDAEIKSLLRMDGYQIQDVPNGGFYVTHPNKSKEEIDREVKAYRQKVDSTNIRTFGIDMNRVINAARADATEGNITDPQDQYMLGVMHLGATMVHEAIHSAGSQSEGPSEQGENKFMQWVMPIINQRRQQRYQSEGRKSEYAPLVIDSNKRRMASSNWLEKAAADGIMRTSQGYEELIDDAEDDAAVFDFAEPAPVERRDRPNSTNKFVVYVKKNENWMASRMFSSVATLCGHISRKICAAKRQGPWSIDDYVAVDPSGKTVTLWLLMVPNNSLGRWEVFDYFGKDKAVSDSESSLDAKMNRLSTRSKRFERIEWQTFNNEEACVAFDAARQSSTGQPKFAQYGAQFLHNQEYVKRFGPTPWSAAYWSFGVGPIESLLDRVRPPKGSDPNLSFEGQLRKQDEARWASKLDSSMSTEELLEASRMPLEAYRSTEALMEDNRERPLMLPVKPRKVAMTRQAWSGGGSYDSSKDAFGWMCNLDLPMSDRVQEFDDNDEETTWFDKKFIRNQPRYQPEYGNPLSKENDIYSWWIDPRLQIEEFDKMMSDRPTARTAPANRFASDRSAIRSFLAVLESCLKDILRGRIRGTRFVCPQHMVPLIRKFFENDFDIRVQTFGEGPVGVWVTSESIPSEAINRAEAFVTGNSEEEVDRRTFNYVTSLDIVRRDAISDMLAAVQRAAREAGVNMLVIGDLPLAVKLDGDWGRVRTVDFCSDDPDACVKIGEIVCGELAPDYETHIMSSRRGGIVVGHRGCVTFRFFGAEPLEFWSQEASALGIEPTVMNCELLQRGLTPLMLAMDVLTEKIVDPTGEALPDVEAKVIRAVTSPDAVVARNPLTIVDAVFLASAFDLSIDSAFANAAAKAEASVPEARLVWEAIRFASSKGKCREIAEQYGLGRPFAAAMGE